MIKWLSEEPAMIKAWIVLLLLSSLSMFLGYYKPQGFTIFVSIFAQLYTLACIRYIRGSVVKTEHADIIVKKLTVWGYIWRNFVSMFICIFSVIIVKLIILGSNIKITQTQFITFYFVMFPIIVWGLFCKQRIAFLRRFLMYFPKM